MKNKIKILIFVFVLISLSSSVYAATCYGRGYASCSEDQSGEYFCSGKLGEESIFYICEDIHPNRPFLDVYCLIRKECEGECSERENTYECVFDEETSTWFSYKSEDQDFGRGKLLCWVEDEECGIECDSYSGKCGGGCYDIGLEPCSILFKDPRKCDFYNPETVATECVDQGNGLFCLEKEDCTQNEDPKKQKCEEETGVCGGCVAKGFNPCFEKEPFCYNDAEGSWAYKCEDRSDWLEEELMCQRWELCDVGCIGGECVSYIPDVPGEGDGDKDILYDCKTVCRDIDGCTCPRKENGKLMCANDEVSLNAECMTWYDKPWVNSGDFIKTKEEECLEGCNLPHCVFISPFLESGEPNSLFGEVSVPNFCASGGKVHYNCNKYEDSIQIMWSCNEQGNCVSEEVPLPSEIPYEIGECVEEVLGGEEEIDEINLIALLKERFDFEQKTYGDEWKKVVMEAKFDFLVEQYSKDNELIEKIKSGNALNLFNILKDKWKFDNIAYLESFINLAFDTQQEQILNLAKQLEEEKDYKFNINDYQVLKNVINDENALDLLFNEENPNYIEKLELINSLKVYYLRKNLEEQELVDKIGELIELDLILEHEEVGGYVAIENNKLSFNRILTDQAKIYGYLQDIYNGDGTRKEEVLEYLEEHGMEESYYYEYLKEDKIDDLYIPLQFDIFNSYYQATEFKTNSFGLFHLH